MTAREWFEAAKQNVKDMTSEETEVFEMAVTAWEDARQTVKVARRADDWDAAEAAGRFAASVMQKMANWAEKRGDTRETRQRMVADVREMVTK